MPLLLFLSALLTALTGVVTGVRPADVQIARAVSTSDVLRTAAALAPGVAAHVHLLGAIGLSAPFAQRTTVALSVRAPRLYLDRPRA